MQVQRVDLVVGAGGEPDEAERLVGPLDRLGLATAGLRRRRTSRRRRRSRGRSCDSNVRGVCMTIAMPARRIRWGGSRVTSAPMNVIVPAVGASSR